MTLLRPRLVDAPPFDRICFTFSVLPARAAATVSVMRFFSPPLKSRKIILSLPL